MVGVSYALVPLTLFALLIAILIEVRLAVVLNTFLAIIGMLIFKGGSEFFMFFVITGSVSALFIRLTFDRNKILLVAVIIMFINAVAALTLALFVSKNFSVSLLTPTLFAALNGGLSVILATGSLPIWEALFDTTTPFKLSEMTNPDKKLLRRLALEAPGTYHHSLIVANLAETAALAIGANATLARVGGYYHDIGKLSSPTYFTENQLGENPHDKLSPQESAKIIMEHVPYGVTLATQNKLPKAIKEIIAEHHGTTVTKYFYFKAVKELSAANQNDYRYNGRIPSSKESAIVMLADTCEAAVRSMVESFKSMDEIERIVTNLIKDRLSMADDNQLVDSSLTLKDLEIIKQAFMGVFKGMYHQRIAYPS